MGIFSKPNLKQRYEEHDITESLDNRKSLISWRAIPEVDKAINTAVEYGALEDHKDTKFSITSLAEKLDQLQKWGKDKLNFNAFAQIKTLLVLNPYLLDMGNDEFIALMDRYIAYCRLVNSQPEEERNSLKKKLDQQFNCLIYPDKLSISYEQVVVSYALYKLKLAAKLKAEGKITKEENSRLISTVEQELLSNGFATRRSAITNIVVGSVLAPIGLLPAIAFMAGPFIPALATIFYSESVVPLLIALAIFFVGALILCLGAGLIADNSFHLSLYNRTVKPAYDEIFSDKLAEENLEHKQAGQRIDEPVQSKTSTKPFSLLSTLRSMVPCCRYSNPSESKERLLESSSTAQPAISST
jgi:hypothetical protein